jgi:hypothetical protein
VTSEVVPSKAEIRSEALAIAALINKRTGARLLVVDASRRFERAEPEKSAGKERRADPATEDLPRALARAARGAYYRLAPTADARRAGETLAGVVDA